MRPSVSTRKLCAYNCRASIYRSNNENDKAIADLTEAIRLEPKTWLFYYGRGLAWADKEDHARAITDYNEAIGLNPNGASYVGRGYAWQKKREYKKALADYYEASRLYPQDKHALNYAARLLSAAADARTRDGKRALELAKKAYSLDSQDSFCLIVMAAAYAELGNFDEAVRWQQKVVANPQTVDLPGQRAVLTLYEKKMPHRLPE